MYVLFRRKILVGNDLFIFQGTLFFDTFPGMLNDSFQLIVEYIAGEIAFLKGYWTT